MAIHTATGEASRVYSISLHTMTDALFCPCLRSFLFLFCDMVVTRVDFISLPVVSIALEMICIVLNRMLIVFTEVCLSGLVKKESFRSHVSPQSGTDLHFNSPQLDTSLHYEAMLLGTACLFAHQLLSTCCTYPRMYGQAELTEWLAKYQDGANVN